MAKNGANGNGHKKPVKQTPKKRHVLGPGPGRPKGIPNKATIEIKEIARKLLEDEAYLESLKLRILLGKAQQIEQLLYHYAYGVPKKTLQLESGDSPIVFTLKIDDARNPESD